MTVLKIDENRKPFNGDGVTRANVQVDYAHHEIHEGYHYVCCDVQSVNSTTIKWMVTVPDVTKLPHMIFDVQCTGEMLIVVTEGADRTGGTALSEINRNRNTSNTAGVVVTRTPGAGTTDGAVTIMSKRVGSTGIASQSTSGGGIRGGNEFILKQNTKYIVSVTTYADVNVSFCPDWYEHTSLE